MAPSADSPGIRVFGKDLLQEWQKYSCGDMIHLRASRDTRILDSVVTYKTATAISDEKLVHSSNVSVSDGSITCLDVLDRELEQNRVTSLRALASHTKAKLKREMKNESVWE